MLYEQMVLKQLSLNPFFLFQLFHACEAVDANGDLISGHGTCQEDDQCAVGPLTIAHEGGEVEISLCESSLYMNHDMEEVRAI